MSYKLFLDDYRIPLDAFPKTRNPIYTDKDWVVVTSYDEFIKTIKLRGVPKFISFDHDLVDEHYSITNESLWIEYHAKVDHTPTGYDCALWLKRYCTFNNIPLPEYYVHSFSEIGVKQIRKLLG